MLLYTYLLSLFTFHYLADATSMLASYLKVNKPVTMAPVNVTSVKVRSLVECSLECLSRNCLCFSYDDSLLECGIGNCLSPNTYIGGSREFFVSCNSNEGFQLFTSGSVTACLWNSTKGTDYATARNDCRARSAYLYSMKTTDKLKMLQDYFPMSLYYWIGLNDIEAENTFRWVDDNTICDSTCWSFFFSGEPNNYGNEDCVLFYQNGIADFPCNQNIQYYICEKKYF